MQWYNEPPQWALQDDVISATTRTQSDFWRTTYAGFVKDDGHFYFDTISGNFTAEVEVRGAYHRLYDQAGLMVRLDERNWLKCGIEFMDGVQYASVVVTRDFSDWSVVPLAGSPSSFWVRIKRTGQHTTPGDTLEVYYALDGLQYTMLRQAYFPAVETVQLGLMCASPQGEGFGVTFRGYRVIPE